MLVPSAVVEPMGSGRPTDPLRVLRHTKRSTDRYLERRGLRRPKVQWDGFRALATPGAGCTGALDGLDGTGRADAAGEPTP
ncbi:hypothetical protein AB0O42_10295 [Streptomyces sp. NPDC089922]|uniref:hypothetical protein n=1 Tax=Streptomyces sp. NPDC089922 TaxID=3155189 RepID=UPI0034428799